MMGSNKKNNLRPHFFGGLGLGKIINFNHKIKAKIKTLM
jgi:hypothetical protein